MEWICSWSERSCHSKFATLKGKVGWQRTDSCSPSVVADDLTKSCSDRAEIAWISFLRFQVHNDFAIEEVTDTPPLPALSSKASPPPHPQHPWRAKQRN